MMICERCGQRPATVHLTEIVNGEKNESHLCEVCAGEMHQHGYGFAVPPIQLHHFLASLLNHSAAEGKKQQVSSSGRVCEKCGATEEQIANQGLLGCGDCYPFFADRVQPLLKKIHGSIGHTGKVPERTGGRARLTKEIGVLKNNLREAVEREDFEKAAQLRDRIHLLENNLRDGGEAGAI
jgi:protein arginine kinase activator